MLFTKLTSTHTGKVIQTAISFTRTIISLSLQNAITKLELRVRLISSSRVLKINVTRHPGSELVAHVRLPRAPLTLHVLAQVSQSFSQLLS